MSSSQNSDQLIDKKRLILILILIAVFDVTVNVTLRIMLKSSIIQFNTNKQCGRRVWTIQYAPALF